MRVGATEKGWKIGAVAALLFASTGLQAQDARIEQTQVGDRRDEALTVPQLSVPDQQILNPPVTARPAGPIAQISARSTARQTISQASSERRSASAPTQLSRGGTAEASTPLSRPSDGRKGTMSPIGGHDRCDPARGAALPPDCARVIENRSAEFARPNPLTLSPEQRLLVDQRLRDANTPNQRTPLVRPGDVTDADPEAPEGQAVAAIVRNQVRPDDAKSPVDSLPTNDPAGVAAVIDAIVGNAAGQTAPR